MGYGSDNIQHAAIRIIIRLEKKVTRRRYIMHKRRRFCGVSFLNASTLKDVSFLDTAKLDKCFDHTATSWYFKTDQLG